jgi:hypothetical protein
LIQVADGLSVYLAGSEAVFLETDVRLRDVRERAGRLVSGSASTVALARHHDAQLDERLVALERDLAESGRGLRAGSASLARIIASVDQLAPFAAHFEGIGATLWSLGLSIRIEDASSGVDGGKLETVVGDVRRLGGSVAPTFEAVLAQARALRTAAAAALADAEGLLLNQTQYLAAQLEVTRGELASLRTLRAATRGLDRKVGAASAQLDGSVGMIFKALQMHDVARQILERVRDDLRRESDVPAPRGGEGELADLAALCELEAAQLKRARDILAMALTEVSIGLRRISDTARGVADQSAELAALRGASAESERATSGVRRAGAALADQLASERANIATISRVIGAMRAMTGLTRAIDRIGSDVKFIALNTMVQAEKSGETRRSLSVLARAVREVSVDVDRRTRELGGVMASLASDVPGFAGAELGADAEGAPASERAPFASEEVEGEDLRAEVGALLRDGLALRDDVDDLCRKLAVNARAVTAIRVLERGLGALAAEAAAGAGDAACSAARARLANTAVTTELEHLRVLHRSVTTSVAAAPDAGAGGTCELF